MLSLHAHSNCRGGDRMGNLIRLINEEFERTVPIIYKEGEN